MSLTAKHFSEFVKNSKRFDRHLQKIKIISLEKGNCMAEMKVEEEHTNKLGGLHGGFSATLVDHLSSYALLTHDNGALPSVSVHINMTYCKGARVGDEIVIDAQTIRAGGSLAFLEVLIKNKDTGALLVKGSHTKFLMKTEQ